MNPSSPGVPTALFTLVTALSLFAAASSPEQAQAAGATTQPVAGAILGGSGAPIPGLVVELQNQQGGSGMRTVTNAGGVYFFATVPSNVRTPYILRVYQGPQRVVFQTYLTRLGQQAPIRLR